ncbi:MAG: glycerol-3-phosphate dehydrogenase [Propionibacteriaceae bacterium]|jgi:glycerol-3-phosphate dehydrogenase (NAD(P)+)|nr:glycerol-3-phosphate dehydrogenase [Propionibacteriaceae bacterium]
MSAAVVTILGAGAMGSALATPLADAGHEVRLWGTHLDDHLIDAVRAGQPHPRTGAPLAAGVATYRHADLAAALAGAEVAVMAVSSVGVWDIARLAAPLLASARVLLLTSKGFAADAAGRVHLLPQTVTRALDGAGLGALPVVAVGGPCKANEVAARQPTAAVFAAAEDVAGWAAFAQTPAYRVAVSADRDGVELCAALKNVYAIALGCADGLTEAGARPWHDLKAAAFAQALAELRLILEAEGCDPWTAAGLAGAGDLEVTGLSGRNKAYGVRLGRGQSAAAALAAMTALEQTVEGVPAVRLAADYLNQRHLGLLSRLPLLTAIGEVVHGGGDFAQIVGAALP